MSMMQRAWRVTWIAVAGLLIVAGPASAQTKAEPQSLTRDQGVAAHAGLDDIYRRFTEGYRKLDAAQVAGLYTEDALYLAPGADLQRGRGAIEGQFAGFFRTVQSEGARLEIAFQIVARQVSNDLAYDVGIYTLTRLKEGEPPRSGRGKFVTVARRDRDRMWRFQVDGYSDLGRAR